MLGPHAASGRFLARPVPEGFGSYCSEADGLLVVRLMTAVTDDVTMSGTVYVRELPLTGSTVGYRRRARPWFYQPIRRRAFTPSAAGAAVALDGLAHAAADLNGALDNAREPTGSGPAAADLNGWLDATRPLDGTAPAAASANAALCADRAYSGFRLRRCGPYRDSDSRASTVGQRSRGGGCRRRADRSVVVSRSTALPRPRRRRRERSASVRPTSTSDRP